MLCRLNNEKRKKEKLILINQHYQSSGWFLKRNLVFDWSGIKMKTSLRLAIKLILQKGGICTLDDKGMKELKVLDETELIRRKF